MVEEILNDFIDSNVGEGIVWVLRSALFDPMVSRIIIAERSMGILFDRWGICNC